jgi:hypothetical protein
VENSSDQRPSIEALVDSEDLVDSAADINSISATAARTARRLAALGARRSCAMVLSKSLESAPRPMGGAALVRKPNSIASMLAIHTMMVPEVELPPTHA